MTVLCYRASCDCVVLQSSSISQELKEQQLRHLKMLDPNISPRATLEEAGFSPSRIEQVGGATPSSHHSLAFASLSLAFASLSLAFAFSEFGLV